MLVKEVYIHLDVDDVNNEIHTNDALESYMINIDEELNYQTEMSSDYAYRFTRSTKIRDLYINLKEVESFYEKIINFENQKEQVIVLYTKYRKYTVLYDDNLLLKLKTEIFKN